MTAFLRERGTPISILVLATKFPLPKCFPGKYIKVLASDERFELQRLGSTLPMVKMRETPLPVKTTTAMIELPPPRTKQRLPGRCDVKPLV